MKKICAILFAGLLSIVSVCVSAQVSQLSYTFDDGSPAFAVINMDGDNPSYNLSVTDGILQVDVNKAVNDWSLLQVYNIELDLSSLSTLQFMVRSQGGAPIKFSFQDYNNVSVSVTHTPTTEAEMEFVFIDLTSTFESNAEFQGNNIQAFKIEISNGWTVTTEDVIYFDYIKLGFTEPLPAGGTSFEESFDLGMPAGISSDTKYTASVTDEALLVDVHKEARWQPFEIGLGASFDFSANPVVNMLIRSTEPMMLQAFLFDEDGGGFKNIFVDAQYDHWDLVVSGSEFRQAKVLPDDDYTLLSFDFSDATGDKVDFSKVISLILCANGTAATFDGDFYIDHIWIGEGVQKQAYIGQLDHISMYKGNTGEKKILIPEVKNASAISVSGAASLIQNAAVEAITYTNVTENQFPQTYGYTYLTFEPVANATGTDTITLTATGEGDFADAVEKFALTISDNFDPEIAAFPDELAITGVENTVMVTGLSDGDKDAEQDLSFIVTSDNAAVIDAATVDYTQGFKTAHLKFTPLIAGTANLTVEVTDADGGTTSEMVKVDVFDELNGVPMVDQAEEISLVNTEGAGTVTLTGISDGDGMTQDLTITAVSSDEAILPNPTVTYTQGETTAILTLDPVDTEEGAVTVTVTVADAAGNASNNGDKSYDMVFTVNVIPPSLTGYVVDLTSPDVLSLFGASGTYTLSIVDYDGAKAMKVVMNSKSTWDGFILRHPELNLVDYPFVSYEVYTESADKDPNEDNATLYHWNYYYDVNGERCILNTNDHKFEAPIGQWTQMAFDYSQPGDMSNNDGVPIDASRIDYLLFNMHNTPGGWPFTEINATCYIRNIKLGDQAEIPDPIIYTTIDETPDQAAFEGAEDFEVTLTGISNGQGGTENVTVAVASSNTSVAADPSVGTIQEDGTVVVTVTPGEPGLAVMTVTVSADGAEDAEMTFMVRIASNDASEFYNVFIDRGEKRQTIRGIGAFYNNPLWTDLFINEMGASAVRLGIISNQWEPVNDNDDPNILNMDGFNYDAFDWQYMRDMKAAGVEYFILTSWSPPAWMKRSMTTDHTNQAITWELTDNILEPYYYEEFAESMVAVVKAFKEEADIDIFAIGLQNEPFFNEPYASAILGPDQFAELIEVVGDRFVAEGLDHVGFYMPEQVFGQNTYSNIQYINAIKASAKADAYTDYVGVHGYDGTGIDSDFPNYNGWRNLFSNANSGDNPKELWMTETHIGYENFSSAMAFAGALHGSLWAGNITLWTNWGFGDVQLTRNAPNSTFYATKQFSKYVRPGAVRVETETDYSKLLVSAYENEDGNFVVVVINHDFNPVAARVSGPGLPDTYQAIRTSSQENAVEIGTYKLGDGPTLFAPRSITTLINNDPLVLTMDTPENVEIYNTDGEQEVILTGISDGLGGVANLTLTYELEDASIVENVSLGEISGSGEAIFTFSPAAEAVGQTKVTLTLEDGDGHTRQDAFYIVVSDPPVGGVSDVEGRYMRVYPNPTNALLHVELPESGQATFSLMDISGKVILQQQADGNHAVLDVSGVEDGLYILKADGESGVMLEQVIIQ